MADSSSVASVGSSALRYRSCPHERVGVTAKRQKECAFSTTEDYIPWRGMGLNVDAGAPVTGTYRVHPVSCQKIKARPVTHCQTVSERLLGLMAATSNVIPFGLLYMRLLQWWLRTKGFSPKGNAFRMIKVTPAMLSRLGNVEETLVPVPESHDGSFMSSQDANNRCLSHGLGSDLRGMLESGSVEGLSSLMAHQPSGDVGCISCSQEFLSRSHGPPCACPLRQHIGGLLHKSPGGFAVTSTLQTGVPNPPVVPREVVVSLSSLHPGGHNIGADILSRQGLRPREWRLHPEVVELIWREFGQAQVDLFASRERSHCPLWFSLTHPAPLGLDAMVQTWPRLHLYAFSLIALLPGVLERVRRDQVLLLLIAPRWPGRVWLSDLRSVLDGPPLELPIRRETPSYVVLTIP